jgi:hypothetical protein
VYSPEFEHLAHPQVILMLLVLGSHFEKDVLSKSVILSEPFSSSVKVLSVLADVIIK